MDSIAGLEPPVTPAPKGGSIFTSVLLGSGRAVHGCDLRGHVEFPVSPACVRNARHLTTELIRGWLPVIMASQTAIALRITPADVAQLAEDVEQVVSEFAGNAVAELLRQQKAGNVYDAPVMVFALEWRTTGQLQLDVWDPFPAPAKQLVARHPSEDAEGGRGLELVEALASHWEQVNVPVGTHVRALFDLQPAAAALAASR